MFVSFQGHKLALESHHHKQELENLLASSEERSIRLGDEPAQAHSFYSVSATPEWNAEQRFVVGIFSQGYGLIPHILLIDEAGLLVFGFESSVVGFHLVERNVRFSIQLDAPFYAFQPSNIPHTFLIVEEIGVHLVSTTGHQIWSYQHDVITNVALAGNEIELEFMDSEPVRLNLVNGMQVQA